MKSNLMDNDVCVFHFNYQLKPYIDALKKYLLNPEDSEDLYKVILYNHPKFCTENVKDEIKRFEQLYNSGEIQQPVIVKMQDNGVPFLLDGMHRFVVAVIRQDKYVPCLYLKI